MRKIIIEIRVGFAQANQFKQVLNWISVGYRNKKSIQRLLSNWCNKYGNFEDFQVIRKTNVISSSQKTCAEKHYVNDKTKKRLRLIFLF